MGWLVGDFFGCGGFGGIWGGGGGGVLSPDNSLTKIWKLSVEGDEDVEDVEDVEVEEAFDEEREGRMVGGGSWRVWVDWVE